MKRIAIAILKGGAGKTSLTAALSVRAARGARRVAMIDLNVDQDSLGQWWRRRGSPDNPLLVDDYDDFISADERLERGGFDWLFLDTPPTDLELSDGAISIAHMVVIPVRPSVLDCGAIDDTVELCVERGAPFSFLLNAVERRGRFGALAEQAETYLRMRGPVFKTQLSHRAAYVDAMTGGKTGPEIDRASQTEINALWRELGERLAIERPQERIEL